MSIKPRIIPFRVGGPIQNPDNFAGRRSALHKIANAILNLQNISLHGERRTGKTSLLLYLAHPNTAPIIGLPKTYVPVYLNFQDFARTSAANVWQAIADAIVEQVKQRHPNGETESNKFLSTITEFLGFQKTPELYSTAFGRALAHFEDRGFTFHFLFDEFDQTVRNQDLGDPFYDALRSLPTRAGNISYVIATRTGLAALQPIYDKVSSPFFNIFTQITLEPFQEDEVYRLVFKYFDQANIDISLAEKLCAQSAFLHEVTGYHPFFLQALCYHLCLRLDQPGWPLGQAQQEALRAFEKDIIPHFEFYWQVSSNEERELIKKIAAKQYLDWNKSETLVLIDKLKDRCLVIQTGEVQPEWRLFSLFFSKWVNILAEENKDQKQAIENKLQETNKTAANGDLAKPQRTLTNRQENLSEDGKTEDPSKKINQTLHPLLSKWRWYLGILVIAVILLFLARSNIFFSHFLAPPDASLPTIAKIEVFMNQAQLDLDQLPNLEAGKPVSLEVIVTDASGKRYASDILKCAWSVAPLGDEDTGINTDLCQTSYTPSQRYSVQIVLFEIEGREQEFQPRNPISIQFDITK